jgi:hypothetical protein
VLKKAVRAQSVGQLFSAGWNQVKDRAVRDNGEENKVRGSGRKRQLMVSLSGIK